ncbi:MAG: Flp pilus assembly protein CpaB [Pirellulales bacterium]|nr:Flp pilus assembly protein CpaB [Pirellulales bacterium]
MKSAVLLLLALGCGLVAAIGVTQVVSKEPAAPAGPQDEDRIFVALKDIAQGDLITPQMVRLEPWPADRVPEGSFHKIEDIEGCRARVQILQGEALREKKLLGKNATASTPTDHIPKGLRVVGVRVDMVSGGGLIRPGDRVDVLVHFKRDLKNDIPENRTKTILHDIKVFAVGDTYKLDPTLDEEDSLHAKTVSLLVTPHQAEDVMAAAQVGKIQLVMRAPGDSDTTPTPGTTPGELLGMSSGSNRKAEGMPMAPSGKSGGIFDLLKGMQAQKETKKPPKTQPIPLAEPETWNVQLLMGSDVSDVMLQQQVDPNTGGVRWYTSQGGAPPAPPAEPMVAPPAPPAQPDGQPKDPDA